MYRNIHNGDFYEPYHIHSLVSSEEDVIYLDIPNKGFMSEVKRWWYDLFLLSYNDYRSKYYYTSANSIKTARTWHFRQHRDCIHPFSKFRNFWDFLILYVYILSKVLFHVNSCLVFDRLPLYFYYAGAIFEIIVILDIFINARTGHANENTREITIDTKAILIKYLSTKVFLHAAAAIPFHMILFLRHGHDINCALCKSNMLVSVMKVLSLLGLPKLFEVTKYWSRERSSFKVEIIYIFLRIFVLGMVTMLQIIHFTDAISVISIIQSGEIDPRSHLFIILQNRYKLDRHSHFFFVCVELSRICKSILLFGYGLQTNETCLDQISALMTFTIAYTFHLWSMLSCFGCLTRAQIPEDSKILSECRTINVLRSRQLPDIMNYKVRQYYRFNMTDCVVTEKQNGLFLSLPCSLKRDIALVCYKKLVRRIPCFADWPADVISKIVMMLKEDIYLENDIVANLWSQGDGLIIVDAGMLAVYSVKNQETGHLIDGDHFGELSLVTDKEVRMSKVVAITHCKLLFLEKTAFRKFMRSYPNLFFAMKNELKEYYNKTHSPSV